MDNYILAVQAPFFILNTSNQKYQSLDQLNMNNFRQKLTHLYPNYPFRNFLLPHSNTFNKCESIQRKNDENQTYDSFSRQIDRPNCSFSQTKPKIEKVQILIPPKKKPEVTQKKNNSSLSVKKIKKRQKLERQSARKNAESNLINNFFSFLTCMQFKNQRIRLNQKNPHENTFKNQGFYSQFYLQLNYLKNEIKNKYVSLKSIILAVQKYQLSLSENKNVSQKNFLMYFRRSFLCYLRSTALNHILNSKKLTKIGKEQHIYIRRKMMNNLIQKFQQ